MDTFSARIAGLFYGGAMAEAAAIEPEGTDYSTGTQLCLYVADGLLEVLDWAAQGLAADPPASIWLALLRWYNNRYGTFPEGLPEAPGARIDAFPLYAGAVEPTTKAGLEEAEMGLPRKPHGQEATGTDALVRAAPLGMIPQVDPDWVIKMSHQTAVLTHADWITPTAYSLLVHHIMTGRTFMGALTEVLTWLESHDDGADLAQRLRDGLAQRTTPEPTTDTMGDATAAEVLTAAVSCVANVLEQPVAPEQLYSATVTAAVQHNGAPQATALIAGQLIGGLLGNTATGTPSYLKNYVVLEETIDRWVSLTT